MPLITSIVRNNEPLPIKWGGWHVACMAVAAALDSEKGGLYNFLKDHDDELPNIFNSISINTVRELVTYSVLGETPLNNGAYTLKSSYKFTDPMNGEILELLPGDTLTVYRS